MGRARPVRPARGRPLVFAPLVFALLFAMLLATATAPRMAAAQGVKLELRPHSGDTLHLRMQQKVEVVATSKVKGNDSTVSMRRDVTLLSRSVVQGADPDGATIVALADSLIVEEHGAREVRPLGSRVTMRLAPDGTARVLDGGGALTSDAVALLGQMPATLPGRRVAVGERWSNSVAMPIPGQPEGVGAGTLETTFRLDSLSRYGDIAYVSLQGKLARPDGGVLLAHGVRYESSGTVTGHLELDRRRGWLTTLRASIVVRSVLTAAGAPPVHVSTRIVQTLHVLDPVDKP